MKRALHVMKLAALAALLGTSSLLAQSGPQGMQGNRPPQGPPPVLTGTQQAPPPTLSGTQPPPWLALALTGTVATPGQPGTSGSYQARGLTMRPRGLRMGMEVADFKIVLPPADLLINGTFTGPLPPAFPVSASLINEAHTSIAVTFDSPQAADRKIDFRLYDANGSLVWSPDANDTEGETDATLNVHRAWNARTCIPLLLNGSYLTPGVYTVQAVVGADAIASTQVTVEVVANDGSTPPPPPQQ